MAKRWKDEGMWKNEMLKTEFDWTEEALSLSENAPNLTSCQKLSTEKANVT